MLSEPPPSPGTPADGILNPVHAMMDDTASENPIATGDSNGTYVDNRMLVKHDFVRYLALKLFNTYQGVDLFSNENAMKEDLAAKGAAAWENVPRSSALVSSFRKGVAAPATAFRTAR